MVSQYYTYHNYTDKNTHYTHKVFTKVYLMTDFSMQLTISQKEPGLCKKNVKTLKLKFQLSQLTRCLIMENRLC